MLPGRVCIPLGGGGGGLLNTAVTIRDCIASNYLLIDKSENIFLKSIRYKIEVFFLHFYLRAELNLHISVSNP
jgi:hypothetical protein